MERLRDISGISFYSLQLSKRDEIEVAMQFNKPDQAATAKAGGMIDFTSELDSFDDTAALVVNLDLVIAMDAVIAHLAGALNIATWVIVDSNPYWGWGRYEPTTVWYKSVRIYRQKRMHRWEEVLEEIRADLECHKGK
jgi:ADP-heptose:LPS heptosyltransferase